ncbi:formate dehydrogenase subunit gamma [Vibrio sp.]|uniref:formate dehydrogenase subunit gamma n=1 Tax=Vibrio sp. TaxID=678 RepID=UPI003D09E4EB
MIRAIVRASQSVLSFLAVLMLAVSLPAVAQQEEKSQVAQKEIVQLAGADYWRQVRQGVQGTTTSRSPEHGTLISAPSQPWYILKEKWMSPLGAIAIFGSILLVVFAFVVVGPLRLSAARTGRKIKRWSRWDRALHWSMAFTFITLALSGLLLVYGKHSLRPYVSDEIWGFTINLAKQYHNYVGPLFFILLICVLVKWWRKSLFKKVDIHWFAKLGGLVGRNKGNHPSAGFSNAGEKVVYWMLIIVGLFAAGSGLFLDFPIFEQTRREMELSNLVHMISALILICGFIFHIYIGLFGMEGALEGMVTGEVDETWAKEHHDLWYEEVKNQPDKIVEPTDRPKTGGKVNEQST